jgi:hypothetical protein
MRAASAGEYAGAANSSLLQSFIDFSDRLPYHNSPFSNTTKIRGVPEIGRRAEPEVLKIEENWKDAIKKSFQKKRPVGGWPKQD